MEVKISCVKMSDEGVRQRVNVPPSSAEDASTGTTSSTADKEGKSTTSDPAADEKSEQVLYKPAY